MGHGRLWNHCGLQLDQLGEWSRRYTRSFVLISRIGCETEIRYGEHSLVHVHLVYETDIGGGCCATTTTQGWWSDGISHVILGTLKTVGFKGSLSFDIWIEIKCCDKIGLVVLKVTDDEL